MLFALTRIFLQGFPLRRLCSTYIFSGFIRIFVKFAMIFGFEPTFLGAHKALFAPSRPLADLRSFFVARSPSSPKRPAYALIFAFLATTREGFVELIGFEPTASSLRTKRSPSWATAPLWKLYSESILKFNFSYHLHERRFEERSAVFRFASDPGRSQTNLIYSRPRQTCPRYSSDCRQHPEWMFLL